VLILVGYGSVSASWYAGNRRSSAYGAKANIWTPPSEPYLEAEGISSWVSLPTPKWIQAGWRFYKGIPGGKPLQYVEYMDKDLIFRRFEYENADWGDIDNYLFKSMYGERWCAYINNVQKECRDIRYPPVEVQAMSEVHVSPFNELNARFTAVYYHTSFDLWYVFDQEKWLEDFPYKVRKDYTYAYSTYRAATYLPLIMK